MTVFLYQKPPPHNHQRGNNQKTMNDKKSATGKEKRYTKITRNRLDECLKRIGWSLNHCGCSHFRIMNQYGNPTIFEVIAEDPKKPIYSLHSRAGGFGEGHEYHDGGSCMFILSGWYLESGNKTVSIVANEAKGAKQPAFISFHNFDDDSPPTPKT